MSPYTLCSKPAGSASPRRIVFGFLLALGALSSAWCDAGAVSSGRPNVLFLFSDDHRWDAVGFMGNDIVRTPALDRLADNGTVFERSYVNTSICVTSRACVLSGQHYRKHRIGDFNTPFTEEQLDQTYPAVLQREGYYTGFIGKWGVGDSVENTLKGARVFDFWAGASHQANYWHERDCPFVNDDGLSGGHGNLCDCPGDSRGVEGPDIRIGSDNLVDPVHLTTEVIPQYVKGFLESRDEAKPFCLSISFKDPHGPFKDFDPDFKDAYDRKAALGASQELIEEGVARRPEFIGETLGAKSGGIWAGKRSALEGQVRNYYRTVATLDDSIGQILEALEASGLAENTIVIYTSDNGMILGEHGLAGKWLMYEPSVRVPAVIYDPRVDQSERVERAEGLVQTIDFTATILDYAEVSIPEGMQGESLRPMTVSEGYRLRDYIFYEMPGTAHELVFNTVGLIGEQYKYIRYPERSPVAEELFDLKADPDELNNLSGDQEKSELLSSLRGEWMRRAAVLR